MSNTHSSPSTSREESKYDINLNARRATFLQRIVGADANCADRVKNMLFRKWFATGLQVCYSVNGLIIHIAVHDYGENIWDKRKLTKTRQEVMNDSPTTLK